MKLPAKALIITAAFLSTSLSASAADIGHCAVGALAAGGVALVAEAKGKIHPNTLGHVLIGGAGCAGAVATTVAAESIADAISDKDLNEREPAPAGVDFNPEFP